MGLETATFPADLVITNPPTSDIETQGANHLQLIKTVLQNCFGTTVRRFVGLPTVISISTSTVLTAAQATNATILVNTAGGAVTLTLPNTLGSLDAGWECSIIKITSDANPVFLAPPSGTIQTGEYTGLTKIRRCIPGRRTRCTWTGSSFFAERVMSEPIGSLLDYTTGTLLPTGFEWPNGQVLSSAANYPEYFGLFGGGGTVDVRGRAIFGLDNMGGVAANRITVAGLNYDGTVLNNVGGAQNHTLSLAEAPNGQFTFNFNDPGHVHNSSQGTNSFLFNSPVSGSAFGGGTVQFQSVSIATALTGITASITDHAGGGAHTILPPSMTVPKLLVVE